MRERFTLQIKHTEHLPAAEVDYIKVFYGKPGSGIPPTALASVSNKDFIVAPHDGIAVGQTYYYFIEIVQADGNRIITAPIWVKKI